MNASTLTNVVSSRRTIVDNYLAFIDRYAEEFERFGIKETKASRTCCIAYAMVRDLVHHGLPKEQVDYHAIMKVSAILIEAKYSLLDARPEDLNNPMGRLSPAYIPGYEAAQKRWLLAFNLRQLVNWQRKGYADYSREIEAIRDRLRFVFSADEIDDMDILSSKKGGRKW